VTTDAVKAGESRESRGKCVWAQGKYPSKFECNKGRGRWRL